MQLITVKLATPNNKSPILLGHQGENLATTVQFDIAAWVEEYGNGTVSLLNQRKGEMPYPVTVAHEDSIVTWNITNVDTGISGTGWCELQYYVGDVLVKSDTWMTKVEKALGDAGDVPEPWEGFLDEVSELASDAQEAADRAEESIAKLPYPNEETGTWWLWDAESGAYVDSGVSYGGGSGIPPGGATGQYLVKQSDAVGDAAWSSLPLYDGAYEVTPLVNADTIMQTSGTYLDRNVVVQAIPYQEVSNLSGGKTATIGGNENG